MLRYLWLIGLTVAACYSPSLPAGSPCTTAPCPRGLVCSPATATCELVAVDAAIADTSGDNCVPTTEICGDGIDQDCDGTDLACAPNDLPGNPIDVTAGGTFTANLLGAANDTDVTTCGGSGGRDVFYSVTLTKPTIYYFDTFASDFDTVVRVYPRHTCTNLVPAPTCADDACNTAQSQIALSLGIGTSCIVVDQQSAAVTTGKLVLNVVAGGRGGVPLTTTPGVHGYTGDTCLDAATSTGSCGNTAVANDEAYYFTACPGTELLDANTCSTTTASPLNTVIYVDRPSDGAELACSDNDATCSADLTDSALNNIPIAGPDLFVLVVDGSGTTCGSYTLAARIH